MSGPRKKIVRERLAQRDLEEHVDYLADRSPAVAVRFIDAAEQAFKRLRQTPEIGGLWDFQDPRLRGIRVWPIRGFRNHLIFYRVTETAVQVLRVLHGSRDIERILAG